MKQDIHSYPLLKRVLEYMGMDNGVINRHQPIEKFHEVCNEVIGAEGVYHEDLLLIETFLVTLTDDETNALADGESIEIKTLYARAPQSADGCLLEGIMNDVFESM